MRPDRIKMFRALEDANPDVGAMVDEIPAPDGDAMVFEEGIDLTDVPAPAAAPPVVANVVSSLFAKLAAVNAAKRSST